MNKTLLSQHTYSLCCSFSDDEKLHFVCKEKAAKSNAVVLHRRYLSYPQFRHVSRMKQLQSFLAPCSMLNSLQCAYHEFSQVDCINILYTVPLDKC